jgi:hypothetical protein
MAAGGSAVILVLAAVIFRYRDRWYRKSLPFIIEERFNRYRIAVPWLLWFWARQAELPPVERVFANVAWMLRLLGEPVSAGQTPAEQIRRLLELVPEADEPASDLLDEYQRALYSPHPYDIGRARLAKNRLWRSVSGQWMNNIMEKLPI